ncbi:VOC family protein [Phenylobacterium sp.]|uniref:VOC family protein n=1 Tax=Phenylobacterium sp. TaxID=1871053 RepID=UPI002736E5A9|nr:VOC family protein [Phenylobacterium sp.]MDP3660558.1 VOC family protein [Phenylobacterium sp.]
MALDPRDGVFSLGPVGLIVFYVADLTRAMTFYGEQLGLKRLLLGEGQALYDCGDVRLSLQETPQSAQLTAASPVCFRVSDIVTARRELEGRGVAFTDTIQLVATLPEHDLWMTYFRDPDGHPLALTAEGPKGFPLI